MRCLVEFQDCCTYAVLGKDEEMRATSCRVARLSTVFTVWDRYMPSKRLHYAQLVLRQYFFHGNYNDVINEWRQI